VDIGPPPEICSKGTQKMVLQKVLHVMLLAIQQDKRKKVGGKYLILTTKE